MKRGSLLIAALASGACGDDRAEDRQGRHPVDVAHLGRQHEAAAAANATTTVLGFTDDGATSGVLGWTCSFVVGDGTAWSVPLRFRAEPYQLSGNPTVALAPDGTIYALCMSVDEDYGRGSLDLAVSVDRGATWSAFTNVTRREGGIPDRPRLLVDHAGVLHLVYTDVTVLGDQLPMLRTTIVYGRSVDHGRSWSERVISGMRDPEDVSFIDGFQGATAIETEPGVIAIGWGDYFGHAVHTIVSRDAGATFAPATDIDVGDVLLGTPCLELVARTPSRLVLTVHEGHGIGHTTWLASDDAAASWRPIASPAGPRSTNVVLGRDPSDRLVAAWLEAGDDTLDQRFAVAFDDAFTPARSIADGAYPVALSDDLLVTENLGSYQALVLVPNSPARLYGLDFHAGIDRPRLFEHAWRVPERWRSQTAHRDRPTARPRSRLGLARRNRASGEVRRECDTNSQHRSRTALFTGQRRRVPTGCIPRVVS